MAPISAPGETLSLATLDTPLGALFLAAGERGLRWARFEDPRALFAAPGSPLFEPDPRNASLALALAQLNSYFKGSLRAFNIPLDPLGSPFETSVWERALLIPHGATASYGQIARDLGSPGSSRAVGSALGKNPVCVIIPCHRVLASDGSLAGYAGGLERKKALLQGEGSLPGSLHRGPELNTRPAFSGPQPG